MVSAVKVRHSFDDVLVGLASTGRLKYCSWKLKLLAQTRLLATLIERRRSEGLVGSPVPGAQGTTRVRRLGRVDTHPGCKVK